MSKTKDSIALIEARFIQANLQYEKTDERITAQCPTCGPAPEQPLTAWIEYGRAEFACTNGCQTTQIVASLMAQNEATRPPYEAYEVTWTTDKTPKLIMPGIPDPDDHISLAAWVTNVFRLDKRLPAINAIHHGVRGPEGHVEIRRAGTQAIRFEPAAIISSARRLIPTLEWQLQPTDQEPYGFKDEHCKRIAHVLRIMCGISEAPSEEQETEGIVGRYLQSAKPIEGHTTHGTSAQRYEAAEALRSEGDGRAGGGWNQRYLIDSETQEIVIRVSDLQDTARREIGSSLPRGWLDARIDSIGWNRGLIDAHAVSGREGRRGYPHARVSVYQGAWPPSKPGHELADAA